MLGSLIGVPLCSQMIVKLAEFEIRQVRVTELFDLKSRIREVGWTVNVGK